MRISLFVWNKYLLQEERHIANMSSRIFVFGFDASTFMGFFIFITAFGRILQPHKSRCNQKKKKTILKEIKRPNRIVTVLQIK